MTTARKAACVLAAWVLVAAALSDLGSARAPLGSKPQREFDYFALSLQWPGTICASTRHCCASNGCCRYVLRPAPPPLAATTSGSPPPSYPLSSKRPELAACPIDQFSAIRFVSFGLFDARPHAILFLSPAPRAARSRSRRSRSVSSRLIFFLCIYIDIHVPLGEFVIGLVSISRLLPLEQTGYGRTTTTGPGRRAAAAPNSSWTR
jgi:hypothetical protein